MPSATHGLAVAGRAVEEQRLAGVHRRPELVEHALADDQLLEPGREALAIDVRPRRHAGAHVGVVLRERHRRRADVAADVEELHRAVAAEIGQRVAVAGRAGAAGAAHLDQLLDARVLDQRVEHRVRQPQLLRQLRCRSLSPATSVFSSSCASVSGCSPVSAIVAGGAGGSRLGAIDARSCARRLRTALIGALPSDKLDAMAEPWCRTRPACRPAVRARRRCRGAAGGCARASVRHAVDDHAALVERDARRWRSASTGVHAAARHDPQRLRRGSRPLRAAARRRASRACRPPPTFRRPRCRYPGFARSAP